MRARATNVWPKRQWSSTKPNQTELNNEQTAASAAATTTKKTKSKCKFYENNFKMRQQNIKQTPHKKSCILNNKKKRWRS